MVSIYRHEHFVVMKIVYLEQDVGRLFSESVLNEVSFYKIGADRGNQQPSRIDLGWQNFS